MCHSHAHYNLSAQCYLPMLYALLLVFRYVNGIDSYVRGSYLPVQFHPRTSRYERGSGRQTCAITYKDLLLIEHSWTYICMCFLRRLVYSSPSSRVNFRWVLLGWHAATDPYETTDDKVNVGRKARPAPESQQAATVGSGSDYVAVVWFQVDKDRGGSECGCTVPISTLLSLHQTTNPSTSLHQSHQNLLNLVSS